MDDPTVYLTAEQCATCERPIYKHRDGREFCLEHGSGFDTAEEVA